MKRHYVVEYLQLGIWRGLTEAIRSEQVARDNLASLRAHYPDMKLRLVKCEVVTEVVDGAS